MAGFLKPKTSLKEYVQDTIPMKPVIKMKFPMLMSRPLIIWGEERLQLHSSNPMVLPLSAIDAGNYNGRTAERPLRLFGKMPGTSKLVAKLNVNGKLVNWTEPVEVTITPHFLFKTKLESRHMVLNSHDMARGDRFEMDVSIIVPKDMSPKELFELITQRAGGKKLRHLVFNCHGFIGQIEIFGRGNKAALDSSNVDLFRSLDGLVETIWVTSCASGSDYCGEIASKSNCNVVGAGVLVPVTKIDLRKGEFDFHLGCNPFAVTGGVLKTFPDFAMFGRKFGFELEPTVASGDPLGN